MIEIYTGKTIDIVKLEEILEWCRYKTALETNDTIIINKIKILYKILKVDEKDKKNSQYNPGMMRFDEYYEINFIIKNIQELFSINDQAKLKLTKDEIRMCKEYALHSDLEEIKKIHNFFIRTYSIYLSLNTLNSKLSCDITENVTKQTKKEKQRKRKMFYVYKPYKRK